METTIAAPATAPGKAAIAVLRVSGPDALMILRRVFRPYGEQAFDSHIMRAGFVADGEERIDQAMAVFFAAPHSYTGEDTAEIYLHGGRMPIQRTLALCIRAGARLAQAGEFSQRAYMNGRLDLAQAEAVMDLIDAQGQAGARAAMHQLRGTLSRRVSSMIDALVDLSAQIEAALDYPQEDIPALPMERVLACIVPIIGQIKTMLDSAAYGRMIREGARVAVIGQPNAGKSTLFNTLCGHDRAIVTDQPGTTRDTLEEMTDIEGIPALLIDTAGLRDTQDIIERAGVQRAREAHKAADLRLLVCDASCPLDGQLPFLEEGRAQGAFIAVLHKSDLMPCVASQMLAEALDSQVLAVSSLTGEGIGALREAIAQQLGGVQREGMLITHARHAEALDDARRALEQAVQTAQEGLSGDFVCIDLRAAIHALGLIGGQTADDVVIERVFTRFCLGK